MAKSLKEEIRLTDLALMYGLDIETLTTTAQSSDHAPADNVAAT